MQFQLTIENRFHKVFVPGILESDLVIILLRVTPLSSGPELSRLVGLALQLSVSTSLI